MPLDQITKLAKPSKIPALSKGEIEALTNGALAPEIVRITRPRLRTAPVQIVGIAPYVQHAFSGKATKADGGNTKARPTSPRQEEPCAEGCLRRSTRPPSIVRAGLMASRRGLVFRRRHSATR